MGAAGPIVSAQGSAPAAVPEAKAAAAAAAGGSGSRLQRVRTGCAAFFWRHAEAFGLLLYAISCLFNVLMSASSKLGYQAGVPTFEMVLFRSLTLLAITTPQLVWRRLNPFRGGLKKQAIIAARGVFGFGAVALMFMAVLMIPLSDATMLQFTAPLFTAMLAPFFLGEPFNWVTLAAAPVCVAGVIMVAQPSSIFGGMAAGRALAGAGVAVAIAQAFSSGAAKVAIRAIARCDPLVVSMFSQGLYSTALSLVCAYAVPGQRPVAPPSGAAWGYIALTCCFGWLNQVTGTAALTYARAAPAVAMSYTQVVWGILVDLALFNQVPNALAIGGGVLICGATLAMSMLSSWLRRREAARAAGGGDAAAGDAAAGAEGGAAERDAAGDIEAAIMGGTGCSDLKGAQPTLQEAAAGDGCQVVVVTAAAAVPSDAAAPSSTDQGRPHTPAAQQLETK